MSISVPPPPQPQSYGLHLLQLETVSTMPRRSAVQKSAVRNTDAIEPSPVKKARTGPARTPLGPCEVLADMRFDFGRLYAPDLKFISEQLKLGVRLTARVPAEGPVHAVDVVLQKAMGRPRPKDAIQETVHCRARTLVDSLRCALSRCLLVFLTVCNVHSRLADAAQ